MTMDEAKVLLEREKKVKVIYGVPFQNGYVFGLKNPPLVGGLFIVDKNSGDIGIFSPLYYDVSEYEKNFVANVVYYSKEAFDIPTPVKNI